MRILGIVSETHDTGIALLEDGVPTLVIEEERLVRVKHTLDFPHGALELAFEAAGRAIEHVDVITTPWDQRTLRGTFARAVLGRMPASLNLLWPSAHATQDSGIVLLNFWLRYGLRRRFPGRRLPPIVNVAHHDAHAAVFFVSPFEEAAVLVMDGYGDDAATSGYVGQDGRLERRWRGEFFDSLGVVYTLITRHLGYEPFEEGTVMALAATGSDACVERMREVIHLTDDGGFRVDFTYFDFHRYGMLRSFTRKFLDTFGPARRREDPLEDRHRDLARALQTVAEEVVVHVVRGMEHETASRNLCFSGGVALNCVANARILRDTAFERLWVPPCASDTGAPLGSALWHYHQTLGQPRVYELTHAFLGQEYSEAEMERALDRAGLGFEKLDEADLITRVARDLAESRIVGWFQGRFEMGPRALGNRSILASPLDASIKEIINARIKHREPFRPFAPAVLAEHAAEYFEIGQGDPFMTLAPRVRRDKVARIPAAVHVDGTGRLQTVERAANPRLHALMIEFARLTGVPILLNTSFNKQEPIVARPEEAISCYLRTEMDVLVLGNLYCTDRPPEAQRRAREGFSTVAVNLRGGE
jgi:carbamoyltransferase